MPENNIEDLSEGYKTIGKNFILKTENYDCGNFLLINGIR